jgi:hypothetical protein
MGNTPIGTKTTAAHDSLKALGAMRAQPQPKPMSAAMVALTQNPTAVARVSAPPVPRQGGAAQVKVNFSRSIGFRAEDEDRFAVARQFLFSNGRPAENETLVVRAALHLLKLDESFLAKIDDLASKDGRMRRVRGTQ